MELAQTQVRLEELQGEVASLTRARDLSERAYKAGAIPLTDVLNADSQLLVARNDVQSTRANAARAAVRTNAVGVIGIAPFAADAESGGATEAGVPTEGQVV